MFLSSFFRWTRRSIDGDDLWTKAWFALLIVLSWSLLQLALFRPYYLSNDDILKTLMAKGLGTGGQPSDFFEGSNAILGMAFKNLYTAFPKEPWFGWFLYAFQAASLWGFLWALMMGSRPRSRIVLFIFVLAGVQFLFFDYLQFTIVSILAVQTGLWLWVASAEIGSKRDRTIVFLIAGLFGWIGSMVRVEALYLGAMLALPWLLRRTKGEWPRIVAAQDPRWMLGVGSLIVLCHLFNIFHAFRSPEWKDFSSFQKESWGAEYRSYQFGPDTKPYFDQVGWSENDLWMFKDLYLMDPEKFSPAHLHSLNGRFPRWAPGAKFGSYGTWKDMLMSHWDLRILVWGLVLALFCRPEKFRDLCAVQGVTWLVLGIVLYWLKATDRVTLPILYFPVSAALQFAEFPRSWGAGKAGGRYLFGLLLLAVLGFLSLGEQVSYHAQNLQRREVERRFDERLKAMEPLGDRLVVLWDFPLEILGAFDDLERFRPFHIFLMSSSQRSPAQAGLLREYGLEDFGKGMVDNPRVLLNCSPEQGAHLAVYLEENRGIRVRPRKVYDCEFFKVFELHRAR